MYHGLDSLRFACDRMRKKEQKRAFHRTMRHPFFSVTFSVTNTPEAMENTTESTESTSQEASERTIDIKEMMPQNYKAPLLPKDVDPPTLQYLYFPSAKDLFHRIVDFSSVTEAYIVKCTVNHKKCKIISRFLTKEGELVIKFKIYTDLIYNAELPCVHVVKQKGDSFFIHKMYSNLKTILAEDIDRRLIGSPFLDSSEQRALKKQKI